MKAKKNKAIRKALNMYDQAFGFHRPYRVLCDGNFLHAALDFKIFLKEALPAYLQGPCIPVVTNCIRAELRLIGDDVSGASLIAKRFQCIRCACEGSSARDCILSMVDASNSQHLFVASQDSSLRYQLSKIAGVPFMRVMRGQLLLDPPSEASETAYRKREKDKTGPTPQQRRALERKRKELDGALEKEKEEAEKEGEAPEEPPKKKRKGPKGVNPLAMKKPKNAGGKQDGKKKRQHRKRASSGGGGGSADGLGEAE
mmetsp:Transcript_30613/g.73550  ORF Transcript_30613/g.73550 Transcript_30613/m.73550 type:complete len:257 (-) Transcript_30613:173-943(-)